MQSRLLAPSAARPEGQVLCVFRGTDEPVALRPISRPRRVSAPAVPPTGLRA